MHTLHLNAVHHSCAEHLEFILVLWGVQSGTYDLLNASWLFASIRQQRGKEPVTSKCDDMMM